MLSLSKDATSLALDICEYLLLLFGVALVIGILGEYAKSDKWKKHILVWELLVTVGVAGELFCDGGIFLFSKRLQSLEGADIQTLSATAQKALNDATTAIGNAKAASDEANNAKVESGNARDEANAADSLALSARKEADAFKEKIDSALKVASEAESHLKDALAHADAAANLAKGYEAEIAGAKQDAEEAKSLVAEIRQLATEARAGVARIQSPRTLKNTFLMSTRLAVFKGAEYTFSEECADKECNDLLKAIDSILGAAGWKRVKPPNGFPSVRPYGNDQDLTVPESILPGIRISLESNDDFSTLRSMPDTALPTYIRAAAALRAELIANLLPSANADDVGLVNVGTKGDSKAISIAIGRKP